MSSPTLTQYQYEIGARLARGDWTGAGDLASECRSRWPNHTDGWLLGSMAALFAGHKEHALALIDARLTLTPTDVPCLIQKAECLFALGERQPAIDTALAAATDAEQIPEALDAIATFLSFANDHAAAAGVYGQAIAVAAADPALLRKRAAAHQFLGQFELAARDYAAALLLAPTDAESLNGLTALRRQTADGNLASTMEAALAAAPADSRDVATLHLGLAKAYEDTADYARSWRHLRTANDLERARLKYQPEQDRRVVEHLLAGFPRLESTWDDSTGESPIFIVGLPRTGTTLVERIIGSHSAVHAAGELSALTDAITVTAEREAPHLAATWLGLTDAMGTLAGAPIAREYLARTRAHRGARARFSDKAPANFYFCPLIFRAFPRARIVHLTRHPLAACLSIYKARFAGGYPFAYDLQELGEFYLGYRRLMAHWHAILPGRILDVAYEDVVTAQETSTRRVLDYLELPFDTACLDFHLNPEATTTSSSVQVRQPLYDSSLQLWRHYAEELAPLRDRLQAGGIRLD